ncbi:GNAT family N-acetyltransferase [Fulvivirga sp.]|uniref:GNAT family N-acetyltransferase n=1 Tax=Fulvivirga sp. TaxID=1931237 RepID=UPI0032EF7F4E
MEFVGAQSNYDLWFKLRRALYHDLSEEFDHEEMLQIEKSDWQESFLIINNGVFIGLVELSLRNMVDGCLSSPVAYIEGIYIIEGQRGKGLGKGVIEWIKEWARSKGCTELASDVELTNIGSQRFHESLGFQETYRVVEYKMDL